MNIDVALASRSLRRAFRGKIIAQLRTLSSITPTYYINYPTSARKPNMKRFSSCAQISEVVNSAIKNNPTDNNVNAFPLIETNGTSLSSIVFR